jgi:hypothetical protein
MNITVMADYCSTGVWSDATGAPIELDELDLSDEIKDELRKMISAYDALPTDYDSDDAAVQLTCDIQEEAFSVWSWEIACKIKAEHPEWRVLFYNDTSPDGAPAVDLPVSNYRSEVA